MARIPDFSFIVRESSTNILIMTHPENTRIMEVLWVRPSRVPITILEVPVPSSRKWLGPTPNDYNRARREAESKLHAMFTKGRDCVRKTLFPSTEGKMNVENELFTLFWSDLGDWVAYQDKKGRANQAVGEIRKLLESL